MQMLEDKIISKKKKGRLREKDNRGYVMHITDCQNYLEMGAEE